MLLNREVLRTIYAMHCRPMPRGHQRGSLSVVTPLTLYMNRPGHKIEPVQQIAILLALMGRDFPLPMSLNYLRNHVPQGEELLGRTRELISALEQVDEVLVAPEWALPGLAAWMKECWEGSQLQRAVDGLWEAPVAEGRTRPSLVSLPTITCLARHMGINDDATTAVTLLTYGNPHIYGTEPRIFQEAFCHEAIMIAEMVRGIWFNENSTTPANKLRQARLANIKDSLAQGHFGNDERAALMLQATDNLIWHNTHRLAPIYAFGLRSGLRSLTARSGYYNCLLELIRQAEMPERRLEHAVTIFEQVLKETRAMAGLST